MHIIDARNLTKVYYSTEKRAGLKGKIVDLFYPKKTMKVAVNNFSFKVDEGEFVGLIGPNGAGKTTLIKMLTGIIQCTEGELSVMGKNPSMFNDDFKKKYSLVMGQKSQLWWDLPAIDSFLLNKQIYGISDEIFKKNVDMFSELFGVEKLLNKQVRQLSLGERMKMELISCLLHDPKIIFLDEPTIGLDAIAQKQIRQFLKDVNKEKGVTILLTSHYIEDIKRLCKRVIVINEGQKIYDGDLEKLLNSFVEYKLLTVYFEFGTDVCLDTEVEWVEKSPFKIIIKTQSSNLQSLLMEILAKYSVSDSNIEDEDVETLIEKIYTSTGSR